MEEFFGVKKIYKLADQHPRDPFDLEIVYEQKKILCELRIKKVMMKLKPDFVEEEASEVDGLLNHRLEKRVIGYYLTLLVKDSKENEYVVKTVRERRS